MAESHKVMAFGQGHYDGDCCTCGWQGPPNSADSHIAEVDPPTTPDPIAPDALREAVAEAIRVELAKGVYEIPHDILPRWTKAQEIADAVLAEVAKHRDAEVERLRAWKHEALTVMTAYQDLAQRVVPNGTGIGRRWVDLLAEHIDTLTTERDTTQDRITRALAVHRTNGFPVEACMHDGEPWPCATERILTGTDQEVPECG